MIGSRIDGAATKIVANVANTAVADNIGFLVSRDRRAEPGPGVEATGTFVAGFGEGLEFTDVWPTKLFAFRTQAITLRFRAIISKILTNLTFTILGVNLSARVPHVFPCSAFKFRRGDRRERLEPPPSVSYILVRKEVRNETF